MENERVLIASTETRGRPGNVDRPVRSDRHAVASLTDLPVKLSVEYQVAIRTQREDQRSDIRRSLYRLDGACNDDGPVRSGRHAAASVRDTAGGIRPLPHQVAAGRDFHREHVEVAN